MKPQKVYITHGAFVASEVMQKGVWGKFGWDVEVIKFFEEARV